MKTETLEIKLNEAWDSALNIWNPSIPFVMAPKTKSELQTLGEIGAILEGELAFMKYPEFQTYMNLEKIAETFPQNIQRGANAVAKHEVGHRYCPYDTITSIILRHEIQKTLESENLPYSIETASNIILNLFTDTCINTYLARKGDEDIVWAYRELSSEKDREKSKLWKVYGKSMELAWNASILPEEVKLTDEEKESAEALTKLFERDYFDRDKWREKSKEYARIISKFLEEEKKDEKAPMSDVTKNIPKTLDEQTAQEVAKRVAEIGSDGLPKNAGAIREFKEIMAGFSHGNPEQASIMFYDMLSRSYDVVFSTQPFGRPRINPFQPIKWNPSMSVDRLDINYSAQVGGRIIPGVNAYAWKTRRREAHGGFEEVVPDIDIYLDSSGSMPNPIEEISLPVLAGFVAAKKAHKKNALIRSTNFSGEGQCETQNFTRDLQLVFKNLTKYFNGGTYFPVEVLSQGREPRQVLIITDAFVANEGEFADSVRELKQRHKGNNVAVYALHPVANADYLRSAGAEVIHGTTTDIFKRVIGKAREVYRK